MSLAIVKKSRPKHGDVYVTDMRVSRYLDYICMDIRAPKFKTIIDVAFKFSGGIYEYELDGHLMNIDLAGTVKRYKPKKEWQERCAGHLMLCAALWNHHKLDINRVRGLPFEWLRTRTDLLCDSFRYEWDDRLFKQSLRF